jgi:hypothetical protein
MTSDTAYSHPYGYSGDEPCARDPQDDEEPDDGAELDVEQKPVLGLDEATVAALSVDVHDGGAAGRHTSSCRAVGWGCDLGLRGWVAEIDCCCIEEPPTGGKTAGRGPLQLCLLLLPLGVVGDLGELRCCWPERWERTPEGSPLVVVGCWRAASDGPETAQPALS